MTGVSRTPHGGSRHARGAVVPALTLLRIAHTLSPCPCVGVGRFAATEYTKSYDFRGWGRGSPPSVVFKSATEFSHRFRMTKADLVQQVADAIGPGVTRKDCALVVDGFLNAIKQAVACGENIEIRGFGTFKVRRRKARMARNPRTGEPVRVPARAVPVFKPSRLLRSQVVRLDDDTGG